MLDVKAVKEKSSRKLDKKNFVELNSTILWLKNKRIIILMVKITEKAEKLYINVYLKFKNLFFWLNFEKKKLR